MEFNKDQLPKLELPSVVLNIICTENLPKLSPIAYNLVLVTLNDMWKGKGMGWIKENKELLMAGLDDLEMF